MKLVKTIMENESGRNIMFQNTGNNEKMTRKQFVERIKDIKSAYHKDYVVKVINGIETPVSKPDGNINNNLE